MSRFTLLVVLLSFASGCSVLPGTLRGRSIVAPTLKKLALEDREIPVDASAAATDDIDLDPETIPPTGTAWSPDDLLVGSAIQANVEGQRLAMSQRWEPAFESSQTTPTSVEAENSSTTARATTSANTGFKLLPLPVEVQIVEPMVQSVYVASVADSTACEEQAALSANVSPDYVAAAESNQNPLDQLLSQLQSANRLHLARVCLCRQVDGFGQVVEFPDAQFAAGEDILIYCEIDNFTSRIVANPSGPSHRTSLRGSYLVIDGDGEVVAEQEYPVVDDISQAERDDFFLVFPTQIPLLGPGRYRMYLVVCDELGQELVAHGEPIQFQIELPEQAQR